MTVTSRFAFLAAVSSLACLAQPALADTVPTDELAARFGALEAVASMSLSPDGRHIAYVAPNGGGGEVVFVADMVAGGTPKAVLTSNASGTKLVDCSWPTDTRLICTIVLSTRSAGDVMTASRQLTLNADGSDMKVLTRQTNSRSLRPALFGGSVIDWNGTKPGTVLMLRDYVPESDLNTHLASSLSGLGVEEVDVVSLQRHPVEQPRKDATDFFTDGHGKIRIVGTSPRTGYGYQSGVVSYSYRLKGDGGWHDLGKIDYSDGGHVRGFEPVAVDSAQDVVYGFDDAGGRKALYRIRLDGSLTRELVLSRPDVDVDELITIGRNRRVVGTSYATDRRLVEYFDPSLRSLAGALSQALPTKPQISILDASADESRLLMFAGRDSDAGTFYLFDKATSKLEEVLSLRPQLAPVKLAEMKAISFPAADGTMIPAYLTLPVGSNGRNLPAIVMPHGGPASRDEWGFDWLVQFFAARGYAVLQPNYRGSAGYGNDWYKENGFKSWRTAIGDIDDAGRWLEAQGIAGKGKLAIFGWSYGGYAALQSGVLDPGLFKAIVAVAPVTDLNKLRADRLYWSDYGIVDKMIGTGDHVKAGSPSENAAAITVPVRLYHGTFDSNVDIGQSRLMADRLKAAGRDVSLVEFPGLSHSLVNAAARTQLLSESDALFRKALGL